MLKAEPFVRVPRTADIKFRRAPLRAAGSLAAVIFLTSSGLLVERRLAGMLVEPLSAGAFLAAALWLAFLAGASAVAFDYVIATGAALRRSIRLGVIVLTLVGLLAISVPGTSGRALGAGGGAWLATVAILFGHERLVGWLSIVDWWRLPARATRFTRNSAAARSHGKPASAASEDTPTEDAQIVQQFVRRDLPREGSQRIDGRLRCDFAPGQRTAAAHVAFCPPLAATPRVEARVEGAFAAEASCKVAELYAHGVRFEVRLSTPARVATTARVEFSAIVKPSTPNDNRGSADDGLAAKSAH